MVIGESTNDNDEYTYLSRCDHIDTSLESFSHAFVINPKPDTM